jgi:hypothetical protein
LEPGDIARSPLSYRHQHGRGVIASEQLADGQQLTVPSQLSAGDRVTVGLVELEFIK